MPGRRGVYDPPSVDAWAIVVAGGTGSRFGAPKQYADLAGRTVLAWSLDRAREACHGVVLVLPRADVARRAARWAADTVVPGGATRSASVRAGLAAVPDHVEVIAVHDAARPLAGPEIWRAVLDAVEAGADAAIPTVAVTDTIKCIQADGTLETLDRARLVAVQTPQAFRADVLRRAHARNPDASDDAALVEAIGGNVVLVAGSPDNIKVTGPSDLTIVAALLRHGTEL
jgi:2-C-methyl-D-erythritol 4-phosphate cytidylyltransferase